MNKSVTWRKEFFDSRLEQSGSIELCRNAESSVYRIFKTGTVLLGNCRKIMVVCLSISPSIALYHSWTLTRSIPHLP
jgi:hypothetical protein